MLTMFAKYYYHILMLIEFVINVEFATNYDLHFRGPSFVMEPQSRLEFSNSTGGWLDCSTSGSPQPSIDWISADGTSVGEVVGLRRILRNGTLVLLPFAASMYRQDIHNTVYRCVSSNSVGRILSRDVQVYAVVLQSYTVEVEVIGAARGCTAILRCIVPQFVKDFVRIISWIQEPSLYIYPSLQGDGKFHQLPSGELLIHNLEFSDQFPAYRCRTMHRLSRQIVVSSPGNVRISEHRGIVPPVIIDSTSTVHVSQDEGAALICISQGCPSPEFKWFTQTVSEPLLILPGPRIRQIGPILAIEAVNTDDAGIYRCTATNAGGETNTDIRLVVNTLLHAEIVPPVLTVHLGGTAEFKCTVTQFDDSPYMLTWFKDGRQIPLVNRNSNEKLVVSDITKEDKGMYQCVVRKADGDTIQAAAELQLGDAPPALIETFIEQTLQPGPSVSLACGASGNPTPHISWLLDGFQLPNNGRFLIGQFVTAQGDVISHVNISHVSVEDGGEYKCFAENRAGKVSHSARLNIYGLPYIRLIPKITAIAGDTLLVKCPVAGYPIDEIKWERIGRELPEDLRQTVLPDGSLQISPIQKKADSGVYTCSARNKQGHTARRSGEINVIVPPKLSPFYVEESLHLGDRASLTCSVTKGDQPLTIIWQKDGRVLETSQFLSITQVDLFTSILLIESLTSEHNGNYSCLVRNLAAEVSHTQQLIVNVPPIIEPFAFQDGLSEGMRTRTVCGVSSGDSPMLISWLKDNEPLLAAQLDVNVSTLDSFSSLLSIASLESKHSGNFTCVAKNPAAEVRFTAQLTVKVPPKWLVEPNDYSVERNKNVAMHCQAQGVPSPIVLWKKTKGGKSGSYDEINDRQNIKLLGNGTMVINNVKDSDEGFYLCQASNGIGTGIGKVVQLRVNSGPYFLTQPKLVNVKKGDNAILSCEVKGDKPIGITWLRNGRQELLASADYRLNMKQDYVLDGVIAELEITGVEAGDSGSYFCQANNMFGRDQQLIQLEVQEPPQSPRGLEVGLITGRSVNLKWHHDAAGVDESVSFIVEIKKKGKNWVALNTRNTIGVHSIVIDDLKPASFYAARVMAESLAGRSLPSNEIYFKTEAQRPTGPPLNISVRSVSSTELLVNWQPPPVDLRNGEILGYNIGYKITNLGTAYNFTSISGDGEDGGGELLLGDLLKYTRYTIVVQAFNEIGSGPLSESIASQTMEDVPSMPPEDIKCTSLSSQSIQISWQPPQISHCNGILQGYKLTYEPVIDDNWRGKDSLETRKTSALSTVISNLKKSTNYTLQVLAYTKIGDGVLSNAIRCQTDEDVPSSPSDIKVLVKGPKSLIISWLPPLEPNGNIIRYDLYSRSVNGRQETDHGKQVISANLETIFEARNLQTHIEYQFWLTASTIVGESQNSKTATQIPTNRIPARIVSFGGTIVRPWKSSVALQCTTVGDPILEWSKNSQTIRTGSAHNLQLLDTGELILSNLQPNDSGNYSCYVDNGKGTDRITYDLLVQTPPEAPHLHVTSSTSSSILLHWKQGDAGGSPVIGFVMTYKRTHGDVEECHLSRHIAIHELKGLLCGTSYHVFLTSYNKVGSSKTSEVLSVKTQGRSPGVPVPSSFIQTNSTSVILLLHLWPDNGCPISHFIIEYRKQSDVQWTLVSNSLKPQRRYSITNLVSSTPYIMKVEAHNVAGYSIEEFSFTTLSKDGDTTPPDLMKQDIEYLEFYSDFKILLPIFVIVFCLVGITIILVLYKTNKRNDFDKSQFENQSTIDKIRDRYYGTIHNKENLIHEKIPETAEDISPYATFQLSEPSTLPNNALLHTFMYNESSITDTCSSPPAITGKLHSSPYYNTNAQQSHYKRRKKNKIVESESDSDRDQLTSSRTESSNQLDLKLKSNFSYQGALSSTSSDISPMSDQKSLPRRSRSRSGNNSKKTRKFKLSKPSFEKSNAANNESKVNKLKLSVTKSSNSFQQGHAKPSDYSIAV